MATNKKPVGTGKAILSWLVEASLIAAAVSGWAVAAVAATQWG
jgi:hypothetical protein